MPTETATFAAGCFWGVEAAFSAVPGVIGTRVGYTGGAVSHPTYKQVCAGHTGHAEAIEVEFDPTVVSYGQLLSVFWENHNPTTRNRQGWDFGSQYRSAVFTHGEQQDREAAASRDAVQDARRRRVVTEIEAAGTFWAAEEYHQRYLEKRGQASCAQGVSVAEGTAR